MNDILKKSLLLGLCVGLFACGGSDSDDAAGNGVYAYIDAEATGDGSTTVSALMLDGSKGAGRAIDIAPGALMVNVNHAGGGLTVEMMNAVTGVFQTVYKTDPIADDDSDTVFDITYTTAPSSTVSLPMGFSINDTGTVAPYEFDFSDDSNFELSWTNDPAYAGGATFTIYYQITCDKQGGGTAGSLPISLSSDFLDNLTTASIPMATILGHVPAVDPATDNCSVDIKLERAISGSLDPNYTGGAVTGRQTRSQVFTIVP